VFGDLEDLCHVEVPREGSESDDDVVNVAPEEHGQPSTPVTAAFNKVRHKIPEYVEWAFICQSVALQDKGLTVSHLDE
jgi:hypothetical protein